MKNYLLKTRSFLVKAVLRLLRFARALPMEMGEPKWKSNFKVIPAQVGIRNYINAWCFYLTPDPCLRRDDL